MNRRPFTLLVCLTLLLSTTTEYGAEPGATPEFTVKGSLQGSEIPEYYHYRNFFVIAETALDDSSPEVRKHFFEAKLGLPPKPEVAAAVRKAVEDGWAVLTSKGQQSRRVEVDENVTETTVIQSAGSLHPDDFESDAAYLAAVQRREREEARRLGRVLGELEAALEAADVSVETFHDHIMGEMAASASMISTEELNSDHHIWQIEHSFEVGRHAGYTSAKGSK